jgi:hypothetical protein
VIFEMREHFIANHAGEAAVEVPGGVFHFTSGPYVRWRGAEGTARHKMISKIFVYNADINQCVVLYRQ